jgi:hypothetical protein
MQCSAWCIMSTQKVQSSWVFEKLLKRSFSRGPRARRSDPLERRQRHKRTAEAKWHAAEAPSAHRGACTTMVRQREGREKTKAPAPATKKRETSEERKKREDAEVTYDVAPRRAHLCPVQPPALPFCSPSPCPSVAPHLAHLRALASPLVPMCALYSPSPFPFVRLAHLWPFGHLYPFVPCMCSTAKFTL